MGVKCSFKRDLNDENFILATTVGFNFSDYVTEGEIEFEEERIENFIKWFERFFFQTEDIEEEILFDEDEEA